MFTGLVTHRGLIQQIEHLPQGRRLEIAVQDCVIDVGDSLAIDGACLTVEAVLPTGLSCFLSTETLARTVAGNYSIGQTIHLEAALQLGQRMGGHWVLGHVDTTLRLVKRQSAGEACCLHFAGVSPAQRRWLCEKGSIAIDGVSLTLNEVNETGFKVMIIAHTAAMTHLLQRPVGSDFNIEFDYLAKLVSEQHALKSEELR